MAKKIGSSFGNFQETKPFTPGKIKPITTEFSKGSIPDSIYAANRESAWTRWRRGFELASATTHNNDYNYRFKYEIPVTTTSGNPTPTLSGSFVGFPTKNKELGMHWAVWRYAGSVRCDSLTDPASNDKLYIESVTEDSENWYVKLKGSWSNANPLPAPFYVSVPGQPNGLRPATTEIFEDRVIVAGGDIINKETINPTTQTRYGYVQSVLIDINPFTGILTFKKAGSVQVTPDAVFVSPSPIGFTPGRFLITGSRYVCTCQDFTHRDYAYMSTSGKGNSKQFPMSRLSTIKPGRFELTKTDGKLDDRAMTPANVNRNMEVFTPEGFGLDYTVSNDSNVDLKATRDNPGVYREFGFIYTRGTKNISIPGSSSEGMPGYDDYSSSLVSTDGNSIPQDVILSITDNWTPLLDELRYCKHIYALKFRDRLFPPEPSDFPVGITAMSEWEQKLVEQAQKEQQDLSDFNETKRALALMDVPPYNCQAPLIYPMLQKLFNIVTDQISIDHFTMFDKRGKPYVPALNQRPEP